LNQLDAAASFFKQPPSSVSLVILTRRAHQDSSVVGLPSRPPGHGTGQKIFRKRRQRRAAEMAAGVPPTLLFDEEKRMIGCAGTI
jgi:hypothetical protein